MLLFITDGCGNRQHFFLSTFQNNQVSSVNLFALACWMFAPWQVTSDSFGYAFDLTKFVKYSPVVVGAWENGASELDQIKIICDEIDTVHISPTAQASEVRFACAWQNLSNIHTLGLPFIIRTHLLRCQRYQLTHRPWDISNRMHLVMNLIDI